MGDYLEAVGGVEFFEGRSVPCPVKEGEQQQGGLMSKVELERNVLSMSLDVLGEPADTLAVTCYMLDTISIWEWDCISITYPVASQHCT